MSTTQEIKDWLDERIQDGNLHFFNTLTAPFKRLKKVKGKDGEPVRTFQDANGVQFYMVGDEGDEPEPWPVEPILFAVFSDPSGQVYATFIPESYWKRHGCVYDQHVSFALENILGLPNYLDEACENCFFVNSDERSTRKDLTALGYQHSQDLEDFLTGV